MYDIYTYINNTCLKLAITTDPTDTETYIDKVTDTDTDSVDIYFSQICLQVRCALILTIDKSYSTYIM